ncbi:HCNGP-like protein-domain-containing protein [Ilyonectria sp. MPI-CAGE-AT-0026]|nr:HCNGP-like protein-domain-containing protein [Ilyonectria sp. MPI-CAGE-AT-0026]
MAGLVEYASSDEEEEIEKTASVEAPPKATVADPAADKVTSENSAATGGSAAGKEDPVAIGPVQQNAVPLGPSLPPVGEPLINEEDPSGQTPSSPYSANRALLRDLTLPSVPNMDIPPSPPGSPQPGANKKFDQFLELKKKGVHFNAKLEQSSALKNPSLMDKLMTFVEINEGNQYSTTLPTDLWDPTGFPEWAFKDKLRRSVEKFAKEKEAEKASGGRTAIDFVPSTTPLGGSTSGSGGISRGEKRKGGWK